jgi:hypothetical protein
MIACHVLPGVKQANLPQRAFVNLIAERSIGSRRIRHEANYFFFGLALEK